jgi:hypothetical protein
MQKIIFGLARLYRKIPFLHLKALQIVSICNHFNGLKKSSSILSDIKLNLNLNIKKRNSKLVATPSILDKKLDSLETTQQTMKNKIVALVKSNDTLKQENLKLKQELIATKNLCNDLHKIVTQTHMKMINIEERLINVTHTTSSLYNMDNGAGQCLLWRITNFSEKLAEALNGPNTCLYSPAFYTCFNQNGAGYRVRAKIYLNGDGKGFRTHMSVYFTLLKGENDALLAWPFRQKVTFVLVNQTKEGFDDVSGDLSDSFRPDPTSKSFCRPTSDVNLASGLPLFCRLDQLKHFVRDNCLFMKMIVNKE